MIADTKHTPSLSHSNGSGIILSRLTDNSVEKPPTNLPLIPSSAIHTDHDELRPTAAARRQTPVGIAGTRRLIRIQP